MTIRKTAAGDSLDLDTHIFPAPGTLAPYYIYVPLPTRNPFMPRYDNHCPSFDLSVAYYSRCHCTENRVLAS
ncbi:hypothetical protein Bpfe_011303 [Biomphalaria pfeifferi]|uniref:Uncharacterized protein n=1 Tax=Biomphalaria pfeifferi TaxID=112525 RepID=A0AAD8BSF1_BIOPF|nr:hypothetical protein Bpfe_011303 [Biomphalaria pfeifferi]